MNAASVVSIASDVRAFSFREFSCFLVQPLILPWKPRLPECTITPQRFNVTRDDEDQSFGMPREKALTLLRQGQFFATYFPSLHAAWCYSQLDAEKFCKRVEGTLTRGDARTRVRII